VNFLNNNFRRLFFRDIKDVIETGEVIFGFNNVIDISGFTGFSIDSICFINVTGLFFREPTSFNSVGVIAQLYLGKMVNSSLELHPAFFPKPVQ
jgi:hypothetical protein